MLQLIVQVVTLIIGIVAMSYAIFKLVDYGAPQTAAELFLIMCGVLLVITGNAAVILFYSAAVPVLLNIYLPTREIVVLVTKRSF